MPDTAFPAPSGNSKPPDAAARLVASIQDLPTLPNVVARITTLVANPSTSAAEINKVLSSDPSLSAKILQLVNSPLHGFPRRITSITYAVVLLGFSAIRNLAMSVFVFDAFKRKSARGLDLTSLWTHAMAVAIASASLAKRARQIQEEDAFMAGLLHDLGKAVMAQHRSSDLAPVVEAVKREDCLFVEAEHAAGPPCGHSELGGALLDRWNLPEPVVAATRWHHAPSSAPDGAARKLAQTVHVGDFLARLCGIGSGGDRQLPAIDGEAWGAMGISEPDLEPFLRKTAGEMEKAFSFFPS